MIKMSVSFLLGAIAIFGFLHSSQSVFVLEDGPKQCGPFCLTALRPVMDHSIKTCKQWNSTGVTLNESLEKLNGIEVQQAEIDKKLQMIQVHSGSLSEKLDKMESKLQAVQTNMESKLQTLLLAIERNQQTVQDNAENQREYLQGTLSKIMLKKDFSRYKLIGTRLLYIENSKFLSYNDAENACREMDGHLATFHNEQEISDIKGKLTSDHLHWLGINDLAKRGDYVSLASGKKPTFFNWAPSQPDITDDNERCVGLLNYKMHDFPCSKSTYFICQAD